MRSHKSDLCSILFKQPFVSFVSMMCLQFLVALSCCSPNPSLIAFSTPHKVEDRAKNLCPFLCAPKSCFGLPGTASRALQGGASRVIHWGPGRSKSFPTGSGSALLLADSFCSFYHFILACPGPCCGVFWTCWRSTSPLCHRSNARSLDRSIARSPSIAVSFECSASCLSAHFRV